MEQSILTWNVPNFVTVILMVGLGVLIFGFATKAIRSRNGA